MAKLKRMDGRIALVTGANRGLGYAVCRTFAQLGARVILSSRDESRGIEAADRLREEGLDVDYHRLDVTDIGQIEVISAYVQSQYGRLDVLVNNAGIAIDRDVSILDVPIEDLNETLEVNFFGPLHLTRTFIPPMKERNHGRIVNVSSAGAMLGLMTTLQGRLGAYRISKVALNALTRLTAGAVRDFDIKVNSIGPGPTQTEPDDPELKRAVEAVTDTVVWLATLPPSGPSGGFFNERKKLPW